MRLALASIAVYIFGALAFGQGEAQSLQAKVEGIKYPVIARQARIQGDVVFVAKTGDEDRIEYVLKSYTSLILVGSLPETLRTMQDDLTGVTTITFRFALDYGPVTVEKSETVPRGEDAFDRFWLRLFHVKPYKVVRYSSCEADPNVPKNQIIIHGSAAEVFIHGSNTCLMTESGTVRV